MVCDFIFSSTLEKSFLIYNEGRCSLCLRCVLTKRIHLLGGTGLAIKLINIGFGNIVSANRIISIVSPESAPIKRIIQEARDRHMLIDATYGRRTRAVIITDSDHVILSAVQPETVAHRLSTKDDDNDE